MILRPQHKIDYVIWPNTLTYKGVEYTKFAYNIDEVYYRARTPVPFN